MNKNQIKQLKQQETELTNEIDILLTEVQGLLELVAQKEQEVLELREAYADSEEESAAA